MIKRLIGLVAIPLFVVTLAACGSDGTSVVASASNSTSQASAPAPTFPSTSQDVSEPSSESTLDGQDQAYLAAVRKSVPEVANVPDELLLRLGKTVCPAVDEGNSPLSLAKIILDEAPNITPYGAGFIVGAAIGAYCPENLDKLPSN